MTKTLYLLSAIVYGNKSKLILQIIMKKFVSALAALAVLFACTPGDKPGNDQKEDQKEDQKVDGAVDLGLSVKWASMNLGASAPEKSGNYYAWGETEPKNTYYWWTTYKWCNGSYDTLKKYNSDSSLGNEGYVDNKTVLELEDDAAHKVLGGKWRIPTDEEWTELREHCDWTPATRNGIEGYEVKSTKTGNNNSIFLPAAGYREEKDGQDILTNEGDEGCYWSSTLYEADAARSAFFNSDMVYRYEYSRCYGLSIRPVTE